MSLERNHHRRHVPFCPSRIALVDQYMFPEKDTTERLCENGISHPIYACNGDISRTLPLDMYPEVNEVHPQIRQSSRPHFMIRDPVHARIIEMNQLDRASGRLEGFYIEGAGYDPRRQREYAINQKVAGRSCGQPDDPPCPPGTACMTNYYTGQSTCKRAPLQ